MPPYLSITKGGGTIKSEMNPEREEPQPIPRSWNILGPAIGINAPTNERQNTQATIADAAYTVNTLTK
jgi:hypothetical protein